MRPRAAPRWAWSGGTRSAGASSARPSAGTSNRAPGARNAWTSCSTSPSRRTSTSATGRAEGLRLGGVQDLDGLADPDYAAGVGDQALADDEVPSEAPARAPHLEPLAPAPA